MSTAAVLPSPASTRHPSGDGALTADRAAALLAGCASASRAAEIHTAAVRASVDQDKAVAFRLQRAYAASGRLDLAVALLRRTPDPTAVLYTSTIHAHTSRGLHRAALALLSEMLLSHGLLPTAHTLSASLPTCGGLAVGRALHGYAVKLALCGEPYVATALLGMYARAGEVGRVRSMMRASSVQKKPGCSAVEVGRRVVEFVTGDRSHPRAEEIYAKLEEVSGMARARGHAPRTELVLHDLDDAAKERALAVHSENWGGERRWR